ncbi:MAG: acylneuraminate cytidylyltransferase family protein [gamma proteobacterium symbiont of Taylorina sp.]|nr:acylneuraminate cytidylyltransferase family protein [gamma proteobacterium symbiont of Taylorina sp.]
MNKNSNIAIITARGGSKGLYKKNVCSLAGKPLIAYTIEAAKNSNCFNHIYVTTDCAEIEKISTDFGATIIKRPLELAQDNSSSIDALVHALQQIDNLEQYKTVCLLQPTSPLRCASHIQEATEQFYQSKSTALISVCEAHHSPFKQVFINNKIIKPLYSWDHITQPRQKQQKTYQVNGAIFLIDIKYFLKEKELFAIKGKLQTYVMDLFHSIDIDSQYDLDMAECMILKYHLQK